MGFPGLVRLGNLRQSSLAGVSVETAAGGICIMGPVGLMSSLF